MERNYSSILKKLWKELYPGQPAITIENFIAELESHKSMPGIQPLQPEWYKDAIVYSLYVDLFNKDFRGLTERLEYLENLGVNCLWLLPILDSPMRDAGFDISGYRRIRHDLLGLPENFSAEAQDRIFKKFMSEAHKRGIRVIFDIAINHTSDQHPWFLEARKEKENPYRDFYIWNKDTNKYKDARIIFKGIETSNWKKDVDEYYFHRFFDFQPDLNYRNPQVILEMSRNMVFWLERGVDGFRADAIPYLWKEDGTTCENHPTTHLIVKFLRAVLEIVRPNTLLLAEACQKPYEVVKYFGNGDECNAGYHFPLMPQIFKTMAMQSSKPVITTLSPEVTPAIPPNTQWFTFLRCHDELSLELVYVTEEDRKYIHDHYCRKPEWDFREGQGISARLSELMDRDPRRITMIISIMLTLPGTPVIYYGDEFGKRNDESYYNEMIRLTGKDDTRFLVRGRIDWEQVDKDIRDPQGESAWIFTEVRKMLNVRKRYPLFGQGRIQWQQVVDPEGKPVEQVLAYIRAQAGERILAIHNLSPEEQIIQLPFPKIREYE
jgi:maltose alpha-D-glucosyltransferase/alpha-amylase